MASTIEDAKIVEEGHKRFQRCQDWESEFRPRERADMKFANADPDNLWQWDATTYGNRSDQQKPCLTINKVRQHNLQIINDAKQNKPGVNIRPVGDGATYDAAQVFEGVVRHIEYQSNAEQVYDTASTFQVQGGIGYWYVDTDYVSDDSFDQEIYLRRVKNPDSIYLDPDISEADGSDARFGFIFDDLARDEFDLQYPDYRDDAGVSVIGSTSDQWTSGDHVRVAVYYRRQQKKDTLIAFVDPNAQVQVVVRKSEMIPEVKMLLEQAKQIEKSGGPAVETRGIVTDDVEWFKIAGNCIIDRGPWRGKYVPIVRVIGEETIIEGRMDRKGHTRSMKDAQRMYNYWTSEATAQVALQTKNQWLAPDEAIEGLESYWGKANIDTTAILPYNGLREDGTAIPAPQRVQPPVMAQAYIEGMHICENQLMMASGQYQSQFGQNENATSGKAINERQRQGDNATYHYIDNLAVGIRFTGKILLDLIPKIYDTERVIRILAKDGTESHIKISPNAKQAYEQTAKEDESVAAIFNPNVGRYDVQSDVGPGYATRRQEAFNAMTQIAAQNPDFMHIGGDLMWKAADFPMADELAKRWAQVIPPNIKGDGPPPEVQQLQGQLQQAHDAIVALQQQITDKDKEIKISSYDATTKRLTAMGNAGPIVTAEQMEPLIRQTLISMLMGGSPEQFDGAEQPQQAPMEAANQPGNMLPGAPQSMNPAEMGAA